MKKIGITGGIGSGKSTVCRIFELLGVPVYYADDEAKNILDTNSDVLNKVIETFGKEVINDSGRVDRKKLASVVFNSPEKLGALNKIVHPAVGKHFQEWCFLNSRSAYILKEAAILFESGAYKNVDKVITVVAPEEMRIQRVIARDKISREEVESRISKQISDEEKISRSAFIITNDEQQMVIPQVLKIHNELMQD